jgi:tRNA-specific 2-thiouridylase
MKALTAIAISGGIDSLFAGYLLKKAGHEVIGIHFLNGYEDSIRSEPHEIEPIKSGQSGDRNLSKTLTDKIPLIAKQLDIPYEILDLRDEFKKTVVTYFTRTYQAGQTPNPCMVCNPAIKFGSVFKFARKMGATCLATGHYARVSKDNRGKCHLLKGVDKSKDQSYFLARLNQQQLAQTLFPLGSMTKKEVKQLALQKGFFPVTEHESQDVCFIRGCSYGDFLVREGRVRPEPGPIADLAGNLLGRHNGLHLFTIGQRRGVNIPAKEPYYVIRIDKKQNRLIVGPKKDLNTASCRVKDINWIQNPPPSAVSVHTRIRYRHQAVPSTLVPLGDGTARVEFEQVQTAVTPGQAAVFYQQDEILGGGWIE